MQINHFFSHTLWIRLMIEKDEYSKDKIIALLTKLPITHQSFYYDRLADYPTYKDLFYVLNYELTLLSIQTKYIDNISTEDLDQLTPWVRDENRDSWREMLRTTPVHAICPYFSLLLESRKKILTLPEQTLKSDDLESMMLKLMTDQKEFIATKREEEALRLNTHADALNFLKNHEDSNLHINTLLDLIKDDEERITFYQNILADKPDAPLTLCLIKVLRMDIALSAIDANLEITQPKLNRVMETSYTEYGENLSPRAVYELLQAELSLLKDDLRCQGKEHQEKIQQLKQTHEQQAKESYEQILRKRHEKERQAPLLKTLQAMHFDEYLEIFAHKAEHYAEHNTDEYQRALHATNTLIRDLVTAKNTFLSTKDVNQLQLQATFKNQCLASIATAREVLKEHRGWKETLANFASAIASILSLGIANHLTDKGFFSLFPMKTDGVEKLDDFAYVMQN